ncbi:hypothetical protein [Variovorax sp. ZT4R33]|uniref:hypothetical protein n=1 Tax=Variovorax sp. ZT4R33 TaxID=3443743 RepID=UPI003F44A143
MGAGATCGGGAVGAAGTVGAVDTAVDATGAATGGVVPIVAEAAGLREMGTVAAGAASAPLPTATGICVGTLLPVRMYRLQAMKPIITITPPMPSLIQKPAVSMGADCSGSGREWVVRGASKRLSPRWASEAGVDNSAGADAMAGSAPNRAAHATQKRAAARLRLPHSGQSIIEDFALNIALDCA